MRWLTLWCPTCDLPYEAEYRIVKAPDWSGVEATGHIVEGCACPKPVGDDHNEEVQKAYEQEHAQWLEDQSCE